MPTFVHGKVSRILFGQFDLTNWFNQIQSVHPLDTPETTYFGATGKGFIAGLPAGQFQLQGMYDGSPNAVDQDLENVIANADSIMSYGVNGLAAGARTVLGQVLEANYQVHSPIAGVVDVQAAMKADGIALSGVSLHDLVNETATANGADQNAGAPSGPLAVSTASWAANVATITTGTTPHGFIVGQTVIVGGINPAGYNGTYVLTAVTSLTFSYALATNPGAYSSGGTAQSLLLGGGIAHLHVTANTIAGGGGTVTIKIQHSVDGITWADLVTGFTVVTVGLAPFGQRVVVPVGTLVNQHLRAIWTFASVSSGGVTFQTSFART